MELADRLAFSSKLPAIRESLRQTFSFKSFITNGLPFPIKDYLDLRPEFHRLRLEGTSIEQEALFHLRLMLNTVQQILLFNKTEQALEHPAITNILTGLELDRQLLKETNRLTDDKGEIPDHASEKLREIRNAIRNKQRAAEKQIRQMMGDAKKAGWSDSDSDITIRNGRMVIPVHAADKRKLRGFIHDESSSGQTVYIEPADVFDTNNEVRELEYAEKREVHRILQAFTHLLRPHLPMMHLLWAMLGQIDLAHAKGRMAIMFRANYPELHNQPMIAWKQARHPLLEQSLYEQKKKIVPLDLNLDTQKRILVISGPNAGGKSVCLKTAGLLQYMLQCGLAVPMQPDSVCGLFERIFIDIGDEQSLENDLSTYSSHLLNMKNFMEKANVKSLFLIDEFGTGTEPQLGGAIAEAVLEELDHKQAFGLITTHYANLKLFADNAAAVLNGAMLFDTRKLEPLYVLQVGNPGSSFAFEIARKIGFPQTTLDKATAISGHSQLDFDQQLQQLEIEKKEIARKQTELNLADDLLSEVIEKYQRLLHELETKKKSLIAQAGQEARNLIEKANRQIERTIKEIRESQADKERTKEIRARLERTREKLMEEGALQTEKALEKTVLEEVPDEKPTGKLKPGDMVRIEEMEVEGELISISKHEAVILFNSVKLRTSPEKISKLSRKESRKVRQTAVAPKTRSTIGDALADKAGQFRLTLDVRGQRADEAIAAVGKYIDEAILLSIKEVNVLHGKGNGILRKAIRDYLNKHSSVQSCTDAPIEAGGHGISQIRLI